MALLTGAEVDSAQAARANATTDEQMGEHEAEAPEAVTPANDTAAEQAADVEEAQGAAAVANATDDREPPLGEGSIISEDQLAAEEEGDSEAKCTTQASVAHPASARGVPAIACECCQACTAVAGARRHTVHTAMAPQQMCRQAYRTWQRTGWQFF